MSHGLHVVQHSIEGIASTLRLMFEYMFEAYTKYTLDRSVIQPLCFTIRFPSLSTMMATDVKINYQVCQQDCIAVPSLQVLHDRHQ